MHYIKRLIFLTLLAFILLAAWMIYFVVTPLQISPRDNNQTQIAYDLKSGSSLGEVAQQLVQIEVLSEPYRFKLLVRALGMASQIKAGNYVLESGLTPIELANLLTQGGNETQFSITFIEGHTFAQMREALRSKESLKHVTIAYTDKQILENIGAQEPHPEGMFFPDTYFFTEGMSDQDLLRRAYQVMQDRLNTAWQNREEGLPYQTPYQALIMASIVEKETGKASERPQIAGVFINRLKLGMRLQTDPTVIYGMGERYAGNIRKQDLLNDTPYNTYTRDGLPPTPIAMPSLAAIEAALHPAKTKALYFVGKGDGSHAFSATLNEHNSAVSRYQLKRKVQ